ncbi:hypothetical protein P5V15_011962 [Pogonomyrmex californicus]
MTKINTFTNVSFLRVAILLCAISQCLAALSDKQLCYDPNCSEPISMARTIIAYSANDREVMSFGINADVKVFSKGAGKRTDLWGVEINGKRGFAPKSFLKEYKVLKRDLLYEVPVYKYNGKINKLQSEKLESTKQEKDELDTWLEDESSKDDNKIDLKSIDESPSEKSHAINVDSISPSYEVIDGTTVYLDSNPSVQPSFVSEATHATALPNEVSMTSDSEINIEKLSDKNTSIDNELQPSTSDLTDKLEKIKLSVDTQKQTSSNILLEKSEAIISSNSEDTSKLNGNSKSEDKLENIEKLDSSMEEKVEDEKKEKVIEHVESDGIFASLTKTFKILSNSEETIMTESTITQSDDTTVSEAVDSNLQLEKQASEKIEVKDNIIENVLPSIQINLESHINPNLVDIEKVEMQEEVVHENVESVKNADEEEKEVSIILSENAISSSDVPSSNNFVHENADKPAKELPTSLPVSTDDSSASAKVDIESHVENIQIQDTSKIEKVTENINTDNIVASYKDESTVSSNHQETATTQTITISSSDYIEQRLSESDETVENTKKDDYKETIAQTEILSPNKILETVDLLSVKETENVTTESSHESHFDDEKIAITKEALNQPQQIFNSNSAADIQFNKESIVHSNVNKNNYLVNDTSSDNVPKKINEYSNSVKSSNLGSEQSIDSSQKSTISEQTMSLNEILKKSVLPNVHENSKHVKKQIDNSIKEEGTLPEYDDHISSEDKVLHKDGDESNNLEKPESTVLDEVENKICSVDHECEVQTTTEFLDQKKDFENGEDNMVETTKLDYNYWKTLIYLCVTAVATLIFTLGYYYIENTRRDGQLIARINELEKKLLVSTKECEVLSENLKSIKDKLCCIEDESFGSNEMVVSLKADLEMSQNAKAELEDQVAMLERDLENATEAGLELERMLREVLSSNNEVNPLAQSVEDLQARLNAQQAANESLTNALNLKTQEIETLSIDLASIKKKCEEFEVEYLRIQDELAAERDFKNNIEQTLTDKIHGLKEQIDELSSEKSSLYKELRGKEIEVKELLEVMNQIKSNNLDLEKLYDVSHVKIEAIQLREERDELKARLSDVEGAHQLLEEHMKFVKEEITALSDQCKIAEKEKKDAETRLEVLSKFFQEKETERQKEEAIWLQKQGEVVSTVERLHTMQNEIQNYKQQIEMLKREIIDQEREYKNQISALETKAHEQWVAARQNERRLEESKAEASQLRNRLTLVEKNLNDTDPEAKLHRLEANGETATSPPLFIGAESSNSPVMFSGSSGIPPPPPPSYLHCFPPYLPPLPPAAASGLPLYDISQRPPPLGGRLSSPPPMLPPPPALHRPPVSGGRYENAGSPPPPMSPPHLLPPFDHHRSPPPPFGSDHIPPLPPPGSMLPPPLGTTHPWGEESLPHPRNSGFHPHQREQRVRNHKGSLHSSGESLDKAHHGKV